MKITYYCYYPNSGIGEHEIDSDDDIIDGYDENTITLWLEDSFGPYIETFKRDRAELEKEVYGNLIKQKAEIEIQLQKHFTN